MRLRRDYQPRHRGDRSHHDMDLRLGGACLVCMYRGKHSHASAQLRALIKDSERSAAEVTARRELEDRMSASSGPTIRLNGVGVA